MSVYFPKYMKCDACRAIGYHLYNKFEKVTDHNKREASESKVYEVYEETCSQRAFDNYGLKGNEAWPNIRLSGEGLDAMNTAGLTQGGGKNPERFARLCQDLTNDKELIVYGHYRHAKDQPEKQRRYF